MSGLGRYVLVGFLTALVVALAFWAANWAYAAFFNSATTHGTLSYVGALTPPPDTDGDGVSDAEDDCPETPTGADVDANGCFHDLKIVFDPNVTTDVTTTENVDLVADVRNLGQLPSDATASITLPPQLEIVESFPEPSCSVSGQTVLTCDLGTLQPGASKAIGIRAETPCVDADLPLEVSASVETDVDLVSQNDTDVIDFMVIADRQVCLQKLADTFRPILILGEGNSCGGEDRDRRDPYEPVEVQIWLSDPASEDATRRDNTITDLRNVKNSNFHLETPTAEDLRNRNKNFYLDVEDASPEDPRNDACEDYRQAYEARRPPGDPTGHYRNVTYVRVEESVRGVILTYWLFYFYNDGNPIPFVSRNRHEGDWEFIRLIFPSTDQCSFRGVSELLEAECEPVLVVYSQHQFTASAFWSDLDENTNGNDRIGTHPIAYVARGSHANYFTPNDRVTRFNDWVPRHPSDVGEGNQGRFAGDLTPIVLPCQGNPPDSFGWLKYRGSWGEPGFGSPSKKDFC